MNIVSKIFSKIETKDRLALVLDVGSSSVGGALFYMQKSGTPKIIHSFRSPMPLEKEINPERFFDLTKKAVDIVLKEMSTYHSGSPDKIFVVLSSPWYASQTRVIKMKQDSPFVFSPKLARSLTEKEVASFEEEHVSIYKNSPESAVRSIEFRNMRTDLNGYATKSPVGQRAKELEMMIFLSMAPEKILKNIEESVANNFHRDEVHFSTFLLTSFAVARDMFVHQDNFLLVDIGGETTDISIVKKDVIAGSISFPIGRNFIIRGVADSMGSSLDEAKSLISLYREGHATESVEKTLGAVILKYKNEWLKKFQESLANLTTDISIPATIFITVDEDFTAFFSETIKTEQFSQYTLTESKFRVIFLSKATLHGIAMFGEGVERDTFLIIESIYINRFLR